MCVVCVDTYLFFLIFVLTPFLFLSSFYYYYQKNRIELDQNINKFANCWPDSLSAMEAERDLHFTPRFGLTGWLIKLSKTIKKTNEQTNKLTKKNK